ncbi:MAG: tRNA (N(6)-L-threonylcarbamoyladenosine(37)-C(2))-methylthiotransferase MtaB [Rhodospirillaceae bacterium]|nr:tRNA (N(6)-L-threonylcarbamoyladenosine(37)-C(2))-methylthiotransferase MtaB [Rhodospirillaceae bacterium]
MSEPHIITLGCRLNTLESEVMRTNAQAAGLKDAVIVNTCAVTAEAERQARQTIRRLRRERPGARIIVTGCAAQLSPKKFADMPEVDRVVGNAEKLEPGGLVGDDGIHVSDIMEIKETAGHLLEGYEERTRAFVQVQQGCDHRCTFCIIPFARGRNRSVSIDRVIEQVQKLVSNGYKEVVLTGVDVCSYGADLSDGSTLGVLVQRLLEAVPDLPRLRLTSLDPAAMDEELFELLADEPRFMPHLHLSLQAADDMVLKRMKRRHSRADAMTVCERARKARPDVVIGADLIAGFPTETDAMFENTLNAVTDMGLTYLHVFPYSSRPGTPASNMPMVAGNVRKNRAARIRAAGDGAMKTFLNSRVGRTADVLVEKDRLGHCQYLAPVRLSFDAPVGSIQTVRISGVEDGHLIGDP